MNLQDVVDELAESLGRSVVIDDLRYRPIVASAQGEDIDDLRARALLQRLTPAPERAHLESLGVNQARRPMTVDLGRFGARERVVIPIWRDDEPLALLWLITGGREPLQAPDFRVIEAAIEVARPLLARSAAQPDGSERASVFRALLAADPHVRKRALTTAIRGFGVERGRGTAVRALAVGYDTRVIQRAMLGRALEGGGRQRLRFVGEQGSALIFLDLAADAEWTWHDASAPAAQHGVLLRAVGTARLASGEDELLPAAERAIAAATVAEVLPELGRMADADAIGPWLMVADVAAEPDRLAWYSPAAQALIADSDPLRRQTIEAYLDGGGVVREVCERLHIHRTTLYYRLENMPEVVKTALEDGLHRSALHVGLKLAHFWRNAGHA